MAKVVTGRPEWLKADNVTSICSVASCVSENFADYIPFWKHNGYWLFDSQSALQALTAEQSISLEGTTLFYYEAYELEFEDEDWRPYGPEASVETNVEPPPASKKLRGYDIVTFRAGNAPECSPLSCNSLADEIPTNEYCLLGTFDEAKGHVSAGKFDECEPGAYRVFAVYRVAWV